MIYSCSLVYALRNTLLNLGVDFVQFYGVLVLYDSSLYSVLWTLIALVSLDIQFCLFHLGILLDYTWFSLSIPWPGNILQVVSWSSQRSHLIHFSCSRDYYPWSNSQCLGNQCFIYFAYFIICVRKEGKCSFQNSILAINRRPSMVLI